MTRTRGYTGAVASLSLGLLVSTLTATVAATPADAAYRSFSAAAVTANGQGYLVTSERGENYAVGAMTPQTNPVGFTGHIADVAITADGRGALAVSSAGQFYASGTARAFPNPSGFTGEITGVALTADGQGALAVSNAGQFYAYGTASPHTNPVGFTGQIVDVEITADGRGAVAVSSGGQYYASGTATPQTNPVGFSGTITGLALTADGRGALAVSSAGQFYASGTATPQLNPKGFTGTIVDVAITADGRGAMATSSIGQTYHYGSVVPRGNADPGSPDAPPSAPRVAQRIVELAGRERFVEGRTYNCNPYTYEVGVRSRGCPAGQATREWCSDFATAMWRRAGADVRGLNGMASSFRTAAQRGSAWKSGWDNNPRPGDAVVYGGKGHVGIVLEVNSPRRILIVEGNAGSRTDRVSKVWIDPFTDTGNGGKVIGYAIPRQR